ncbi:MAG: N-acetylglucosamine-6-phosphate deacetylase [Dehalococcoidia bacterium]
MTRFAVTDVRLVQEDGVQSGWLLVEDGRIAAIATEGAPPDGVRTVEGGGRYLAPGLIDIHVHGGGGHSLMTDDPDEVRAYARWVVRHGVTTFLVSTSGPDHASIVRRLRAVAPAVGEVERGARVLGFHLEGPYINPVRKGAFPPRWLRPPDAHEYAELFEASGGAVRQVTLAPELPGADALIDAVERSGATASIGHSDATYEEAMRAFERGVTHATHCFNAMRPFGHRDPGLLGAIMTSHNVTAELIGDGAHVDDAAARVLVRAKGASRVVLVTDGMPLAGTPDGEAEWEGTHIRVEGGKAVREDGTIVGGVMTLDAMVRRAVDALGVPLSTAIAMASTNPARALRLAGVYGALAAGRAADFILLDESLEVAETWVAGERVYSATEA